MAEKEHKMDFDALVSAIQHRASGCAVNISLTLRNWAIGCYIRETSER